MLNAEFDWDALGAMWIAHADLAVAFMAEQHPDETFYVLVFMLDQDMFGPTIAMNSLEALSIDADQRAGGFDDPQWIPFEWGLRESVDFEDEAGDNVRLYTALHDFAKDGSRAHWSAAYERHEALIVEAAHRVAERARQREGAFARLKMADDFVVFAREHDVRRPFYMARRSIEPAVLRRFFERDIEFDRQRADIATKPEAERVAYLVSRLGTYGEPVSSEEAQEQLAALGAAAVPALIALLDPAYKPAHGIGVAWMAAMILSRIGAPAAESAAAELLAAAHREGPTARWAAAALGKLGRFEELMGLEGHGVEGLVAGRPRSYTHLEALLDCGDEALRKAVEKRLRPGSAAYVLAAEDFDAAAAYATSAHAAIRQDVALAMADPDIGTTSFPRAVALLTDMLDDPTAETRRLAALGLQRLRGDAVAAVPRLRELENDAVSVVAAAAKSALAEILWKPEHP